MKLCETIPVLKKLKSDDKANKFMAFNHLKKYIRWLGTLILPDRRNINAKRKY